MHNPGCELPRIHLLKLSEKGYEERSEREYGRYTEAEMDRTAPLWRPPGQRCKRLRGFSDGFSSTTSLTTGALAERSFVERFLEDESRSLVPFWGILIRTVAIWGVIFYRSSGSLMPGIDLTK